MAKKDEEYVHILIEMGDNHKAPIKMRELELDELKESLKNNSIYLCDDQHPLFLLKNGEVYPIQSICKIYHPNAGRNATFN